MIRQVKRSFVPGSEWVYYKLYCGLNTADSIIINFLKPLTLKLIKNEVIDKWFFIRYQDPEQHLRVRFHLKDIDMIGFLFQQLHAAFKSHIESGLVWDIQIATYNRELERYGENTIEDLESYFYYDSEQVAKIIKESSNEENRFENVFEYIDDVINVFLPSPEKKNIFLNQMQLNFKKEFLIDKIGKKQLSKKYRVFKNKNSATNTVRITNRESMAFITAKIKGLERSGGLHVSLEDLLSSIIHMTVNRSFQSRQRFYEMLLYDFLYQKNKSQYYKSKQNNN